MAFFHRSKTPTEGSLRPTRRRDHLAALFSRSRSPSPSPSRAQTNNADAVGANQLLRVSSSSDARRPQDHAFVTPDSSLSTEAVAVGGEIVTTRITPQVTISEAPDFQDETLDLPKSAYRMALSSLNDDQREQIEEQQTIRILFEQLNKNDQGHQERSLLRKGLIAVKPYLERLNATIDFVSPFASIDPAVGTAFGLIKGTASIAIAICGRFDDMTKDIAGFLQRIPAIDRCSDVARDGRLPDIYEALVAVYKDLLLFYVKTVALFQRSGFVLHVALEALKPAIAEIVTSFNTHADILSKLLESESFASIQEIKDEQVEALIRDTLDRNREYESSYHNDLKRRADTACSWITSNDSFSYWLLNSHDSNLLALFGDMGCGKTMTTAFVADTLAQGGRPLCAYYCKDEHESAKLGNIYRSILLQFLQRKPLLKLRFRDWYRETSKLVPGTPTQSDEKLRELLFEIISSSKEPVFLVLDALDECKVYPRKQLFSLFGDLFKNNAHLKVFMSSRYDDEIEADLPPGVTKMELRPSKDRDRAIAAYLVAEINLPAGFQPKLVEELAAMSHGSAIWLRIAVEYMAGSRIQNEKGLEMALSRLPSSKGLAELYGKLFGKVCDGFVDNETLLQSALEILAVSRRPLTLEELAWAVFIVNPVGEDATTFLELDELANSVDLFSLVRPFITASISKDGKTTRLRLVHLSLKELLLTAPPSEWCSAEAVAKSKRPGRLGELDANLLQRCIKYLLLEECGERLLFPDSVNDSGEGELLAIGAAFDDEADAHSLTSASTSLSGPSPHVFDPSQLGFGKFFAYAAAHWTSHFSEISPERRPDLQQLTALCQKGSQRLENWVQQWRRPNCSHAPEFDFPDYESGLDPLVIAALFGPAASVTDLLNLVLDGSILTKDSPWTAIRHLIRRGHIATIKGLVQDNTLQQILCCCKFLYTVIPTWRWSTVQQSDTSKDWGSIFAFLITHLRHDLLECGNDILRRAASCGCLVLIRELFKAAEKDPELRKAIITPEVNDLGQSRGFWSQHQSIGQAAYEGHADIVRFLCEQPGLGLESHLRFVNQEGHTVFHQAARSRNTEVFRILMRHWPEGVDIRNNGGDTPLVLIIFNNSQSEANRIKLIRLLLTEGKADATGRCDEAGYSPLCTATRGGNTELLRVLVKEGGADVWQVIEVGGTTRKPFLARGMDTFEDGSVREQMLKILCSLLPIAVSMEYL